ncbi:hypothetical protein HZF02_26635 [Pseudomonas yamanorum]|nr:hypothetical protein HZF02_26635 [Pseudomonas yamanorum]
MCDQSESTKRTAELAKLMRDPRAVMALIAENERLRDGWCPECNGTGDLISIIGEWHGDCAACSVAEIRHLKYERDQFRAENEALREEVTIADKIIVERNLLLDAIPACPVHGQCIPHAIEWVEKIILVAKGLSAEVEELRKGAARYQWLRDRDLETVRDGGIFAGMTPENVILNGLDLDQQIDYAITMGEQS